MVEAALAPSATVEIGGRKFHASDVYNVVVEVLDSGNTDIEEDQYQRPLSFIFDQDAQILSAEVLYEEPSEINASLSNTDNTVTLNPVLLNAGDIELARIGHGHR